MNQTRALQIAVALAGLVPVSAGLTGALWPDLFFASIRPGGLTHAAYLSGLLLGIGLCFWSLVPTIQRQRRAFGVLTAIVFLGGLARLLLAARLGVWGPSVLLPLVMELAVTPALWAWQRRISRNTPSPSLSTPE